MTCDLLPYGHGATLEEFPIHYLQCPFKILTIFDIHESESTGPSIAIKVNRYPLRANVKA